MVLALLASVAISSATVPATLQPTEVWKLSRDHVTCSMERPFGDGERKVTLAIRQQLFDDTIMVVLVTRDVQPATLNEAARIILHPSEAVFDGTADSGPIGKGLQTNIIAIDVAALQPLKRASGIGITTSGGRRYELTDLAAAAGLFGLEPCKRAAAAEVTLDPKVLDQVATPAKPNADEARWITIDDYPKEAIRAGQKGEVVMAWTIDTEGHPHDCRIVSSSHSAALDGAACKAMMRRAGYRPAVGKDGRPMRWYAVRKVKWVLPVR